MSYYKRVVGDRMQIAVRPMRAGGRLSRLRCRYSWCLAPTTACRCTSYFGSVAVYLYGMSHGAGGFRCRPGRRFDPADGTDRGFDGEVGRNGCLVGVVGRVWFRWWVLNFRFFWVVLVWWGNLGRKLGGFEFLMVLFVLEIWCLRVLLIKVLCRYDGIGRRFVEEIRVWWVECMVWLLIVMRGTVAYVLWCGG